MVTDEVRIKTRFWAKVDKGKGSDACWQWTASKDENGYGFFSVKRTMCKTHRMAWILTHGDIPEGMHVLHRCDNPACCNPAHLFLGTHSDNMRDMTNKGRHPKISRSGEQHLNAKLTENHVREARQLRRVGWMYKDLAVRYGVHMTTIRDAVIGKTWKSITEANALRWGENV